jgi:U3 small nucleolar RNA-associated protein 22
VEGSGRWPDDERAAEKLRAALGCQMAQALESQFGLFARASEAFVDVYMQGFAVRLRIWSNRDAALADRAKKVWFD